MSIFWDPEYPLVKVSTAPAAEPVSSTEAKAYLRVTDSNSDTLIGSLIKAARDIVEGDTGRAMINRTLDAYFTGWPYEQDRYGGYSFWLPFSPLSSVSAVYYTPENTAEATLSSGNYNIDTASEPGRVTLAADGAWPSDSLEPTYSIRIRYVAGYGTAGSSVPEALRTATLIMINTVFEQREAFVVGQPIQPYTDAYRALISPFIIHTWRH